MVAERTELQQVPGKGEIHCLLIVRSAIVQHIKIDEYLVQATFFQLPNIVQTLWNKKLSPTIDLRKGKFNGPK